MSFGIKPVILLNHVVIFQTHEFEAARYPVASRRLYTTRHFNTGLELKFLVVSPDSPEIASMSADAAIHRRLGVGLQ